MFHLALMSMTGLGSWFMNILKAISKENVIRSHV